MRHCGNDSSKGRLNWQDFNCSAQLHHAHPASHAMSAVITHHSRDDCTTKFRYETSRKWVVPHMQFIYFFNSISSVAGWGGRGSSGPFMFRFLSPVLMWFQTPCHSPLNLLQMTRVLIMMTSSLVGREAYNNVSVQNPFFDFELLEVKKCDKGRRLYMEP